MNNLAEKLNMQNVSLAIIAGILFAALSFWILLAVSPAYKAKSEVLIINNESGIADSYTMAKSAEYFSRLISNVVYSESFIDQVLQETGSNSFTRYSDRLDKIENWEKKIKITRSIDVSIIEIEVLGDNIVEAQKISDLILNVLTQKNDIFLGKNQDIEVRVLTGTVIQNNPGVVQIVVTILLGFILGILSVILGIYLKATYALNYQKQTQNSFPAFSHKLILNEEKKKYSPNIHFEK